MATNKNATIRYQALDRCFRNPGRRYSINDLIEACNDALLELDPSSSGVKRRQIYEDIKFMKDSLGYDAPIESYKEGRNAYYRYSEKDFSINNQPLNEQEAQQLKESLMTLSRFKGMPQFEWVEEIKARLEQSFSLKTEEHVISFDDNKFLVGKELIGNLYTAIVNKKVVSIEYKPYGKDSITTVISPYHLKQYNNRWFLFGKSIGYDNLTNFPLDRIISITEDKTKYEPNNSIDFNEYFDDVIGVSFPLEQEAQKIVLKIDIDRWPYIKTKPIHGSQKIKEENEDFATIEIELIINRELVTLILSFGEDIEIVKPTALREYIITKIKLINSKYNLCAD
jgi:predicted DNA-binding transcriptional regulator YafY